jgi:hypothetical protein
VWEKTSGRTHVFVGTVPFARLLSINQDTISYPNIGPPLVRAVTQCHRHFFETPLGWYIRTRDECSDATRHTLPFFDGYKLRLGGIHRQA